MSILASVVDWRALAQVIWVSLAAGVGLSLVFSLAIAGAARAGQKRRAERHAAALVWSTIALLAGALCAVAVVLGVVIMLRK
jgi:hypothetical protein